MTSIKVWTGSSRKASIAALILAAFAAAAAWPAQAGHWQVEDGGDYVLEQITARAWYLRQEIGVREAPSGNVTILEQSDGFIVVDTGSTHRRGEAIADHITALGKNKPVKAIVITHWHGDHPLGAPGLLRRWPNAAIISSRATRAEMEKRYEDQFPLLPGSAKLDAYRARTTKTRASVARRGSAESLAPEIVAGNRRVLADLDRLLAERPGQTLVLPTLTFAERLMLHDPDYPVELLFLGKANTEGDIILWAPADRLVAAGDIVVSPMPYAFGSYPAEWVQTIKRIRALEFSYLVPGHGRLLRDDSYLLRLSNLIAETERQIAAQVADGVPEESIPEMIDIEPLRQQFAGSNPYHRDLFDRYFVAPMVENVVREREPRK